MKCPRCFSMGTRLHCEIRGNGETPLLFLHGFAASSATWEEIEPHFPHDRYTLYLLDLKGCGRSAKPRDGAYSPGDQARLVLDLIEGLGIRRVTLVGHSLGGGIALLVWRTAQATGRSSLLARLVLIDAAAYRQPLPRFFRWLRKPLLGWLLLTLVPLKTMVKYNLDRVYGDPSQVTDERIARYRNSFRGDGIIAALIATAQQVDAGENDPDHRNVTIPTLIVWGRRDRVVRLEQGERLHAEIKGSRLVIFECGHNPHEEEAEACAAAIVEFLEETA